MVKLVNKYFIFLNPLISNPSLGFEECFILKSKNLTCLQHKKSLIFQNEQNIRYTYFDLDLGPWYDSGTLDLKMMLTL